MSKKIADFPAAVSGKIQTIEQTITVIREVQDSIVSATEVIPTDAIEEIFQDLDTPHNNQ